KIVLVTGGGSGIGYVIAKQYLELGATVGFPGMVHTGAARAGVDNMTKTLAIEWTRYNIRINAVAPGIILSSGLDTYPPAILKGITDSIPNKRMGSMEEVGWSVLFLSSPMATYINGETLYVDGGNRLWGDQWKM
ncbi:unnamed protein product, partial [Darwinula stevensoni]